MDIKLTPFDVISQDAICNAIGNQIGQTALAIATALLATWTSSGNRPTQKIATFVVSDPSFPQMEMIVAAYDDGALNATGNGYVHVTFHVAVGTLYIEAWRATASDKTDYVSLNDTSMVGSLDVYARVIAFVALMQSTYATGNPPFPDDTTVIVKT